MKLINLWFDGILMLDVTVKKELLCGEEQIDIRKDRRYIGRLDTETHKLVYKKGLSGHNYKVERR